MSILFHRDITIGSRVPVIFELQCAFDSTERRSHCDRYTSASGSLGIFINISCPFEKDTVWINLAKLFLVSASRLPTANEQRWYQRRGPQQLCRCRPAIVSFHTASPLLRLIRLSGSDLALNFRFGHTSTHCHSAACWLKCCWSRTTIIQYRRFVLKDEHTAGLMRGSFSFTESLSRKGKPFCACKYKIHWRWSGCECFYLFLFPKKKVRPLMKILPPRLTGLMLHLKLKRHVSYTRTRIL